jgi:hypothetical protein
MVMLKYLKTAYQSSTKFLATKDEVDMWKAAFLNVPTDKANKAAKLYVEKEHEKNHFPPSIGDIMGIVKRMQKATPTGITVPQIEHKSQPKGDAVELLKMLMAQNRNMSEEDRNIAEAEQERKKRDLVRQYLTSIQGGS